MRRLPLLALALATCHPLESTAPSLTANAGTSPAISSLDLAALDIAEAQRRMAAGSLDAVTLTQAHLARIAALDRSGPRLHSILELNPHALAEAERLDRERRSGRVRGPLHGVPILIKDNIDVRGLVSSAGSLALADHHPRRDAEIVSHLRAAGVVILGKTNLSEWANLRSPRSTSGWSSRGGLTRNPYALDHNPCGSSSGTGAAIAASLAVVGVGTETDGSIMCPSAVHALVGLKPGVGVLGQRGIIPISATQDSAGPMARTVRDAALLLTAMTDGAIDYAAKLGPDALRGRRIGVLRQAMGRDPAVDAVSERALAALRAAGAELVDVEISTWGQWDGPELELLLHEFKAGLDAYLADLEPTAPVHSLRELIAWNEAHRRVVMPYFGQELLVQAQARGGLDSPIYLRARAEARRLAWDEGLRPALTIHDLDALVAPTTGTAWPTDLVHGDRFSGSGTSIAAVAGTPCLTVPMGEHRGLPLGLAFLGDRGSEAELLALGHAFEQATLARKPPTYRATLP
jgi:amidase